MGKEVGVFPRGKPVGDFGHWDCVRRFCVGHMGLHVIRATGSALLLSHSHTTPCLTLLYHIFLDQIPPMIFGFGFIFIIFLFPTSGPPYFSKVHHFE